MRCSLERCESHSGMPWICDRPPQNRLARKEAEDFLANRIGFANERIAAKPVEGQESLTKPSTEWPFQRFSWTDHDANTGDTVSYRVIPVVRRTTKLEVVETQASEWSPAKTLGKSGSVTFQPFFNRGFVMSQFMARFLAERKLTLKQFKDTIKDQDDRTIRTFLAGDLRRALLEQLDIAAKEKVDIFAALFELSDDELIGKLGALGPKAHLVLSNGSITARTGESSADARARDENDDARKLLYTGQGGRGAA